MRVLYTYLYYGVITSMQLRHRVIYTLSVLILDQGTDRGGFYPSIYPFTNKPLGIGYWC